MHRSIERHFFTVGRGPGDRESPRVPLAMYRSIERHFFTVGRGPGDRESPRVPLARHRAIKKRSRGTRTPHFTVGRGPVPRHASIYRTSLLHRRARSCASPCIDLSNVLLHRRARARRVNDRGGQAPALRDENVLCLSNDRGGQWTSLQRGGRDDNVSA